MKNYICTTCGMQFTATNNEPKHCPICEDERQYVNPDGQQWTTLKQIQKNHKIVVQKKEPNLYGIGSTPAFGIGQRALFITTPAGNILWDCISLIDEAIIDFIKALGGIDAIAISHPHYYTSMVEWSHAFNDAPIYLHANDRQWIQRESDAINFWTADHQQITGELTLYNAGGHFEGGTILHWPNGANKQGALLTGDILQVTADRKHVSFMYSYPNNIPLNTRAINRITKLLAPITYDRIYGAWWNRIIQTDSKKAVQKSAQRYKKAIC